MCGIAGILKVHPPGSDVPPPEVAIPESWLDILEESIKHRGPDGQGRFRDRATRPDGSIVDVALVHRRLAIIDLAGGQQPMVSERGPHPDKPRNGRVAVVFNGCIYNHRELRRELQSAGHKFVTDHSDTEVLIHGWREWGHGLFAKLDGMFAVAIWDAASAFLVRARDRFSEKPLYEFADKSVTAVCSDAPGVAKLRRRLVDPNGPRGQMAQFERVATWLQFGWDQPLPLAGIHQCVSGFSIRAPNDPEGSKEYWGTSFLCARRTEFLTPAELDRLLQHAVSSRLVSDVPLGIFLSGGIDSALVAAFARESTDRARAFTVRMPTSEFDESEAAMETARSLGISHTILSCEADAANDVIRLIQELGLPFGDSSLLPAFWVSRAARAAVKVALGGDGGDELFLGYERHRALPILHSLSRFPVGLLRTGAAAMGGPASPHGGRRRIARLLDAASNSAYADLLAIFPTSIFRNVVDYDVTRSGRKHGSTSLHSARGCALPEFESSSIESDLKAYLPEDLLRKTDTASMSVALEVRAPFLAKELVDRMIRVRPDVLMPDGERKGLLKAVARKYLPDEIVDRPKMGFSIPIGEWFRTDYGGMKQLLLDTLNSADPFPEESLGIRINRTFVARMVEDHMERRRDHSQRLYMLLVLAIWTDWLRSLSGPIRN